jgi:hypothetical protein
MGLSDDLSPAEQELARRLSGLAVDPSPAARESIMRAVAAARLAEAPRWHLRWRAMAAVAAALVVLITGTIGAMAASSQALPNSPGYALRGVGEQLRIALANPLGKEQLRIQFARDRFHEVPAVVHMSRSAASRLVNDGKAYLKQAQRDLPSLAADQQGKVSGQLNQAGQDEQGAQDQLNQNQGGNQQN